MKTNLVIAVLFSIAAVLFIASSALADSSMSCVNTSTLFIRADLSINGTQIVTEENVTCPFGCLNSDCAQGSLLNEFGLVFFLGIFFLMSVIGYKFRMIPSVVISAVFLIILALLLLNSGVVLNGVLYTGADTPNVTYLAFIFIGVAIFTIATGFLT